MNTDDALQKAYAAYWLGLRDKLSQYSRALVGTDFPRFAKKKDLSKQEELQQWHEDLQSQRSQSDAQILAQLSGKTVALNNQARFFLALRFQTIQEHLEGFVFQRDGEDRSVLPPPDESDEEVLTHLLIDWWWHRGHLIAFLAFHFHLDPLP